MITAPGKIRHRRICLTLFACLRTSPRPPVYVVVSDPLALSSMLSRSYVSVSRVRPPYVVSYVMFSFRLSYRPRTASRSRIIVFSRCYQTYSLTPQVVRPVPMFPILWRIASSESLSLCPRISCCVCLVMGGWSGVYKTVVKPMRMSLLPTFVS